MSPGWSSAGLSALAVDRWRCGRKTHGQCRMRSGCCVAMQLCVRSQLHACHPHGCPFTDTYVCVSPTGASIQLLTMPFPHRRPRPRAGLPGLAGGLRRPALRPLLLPSHGPRGGWPGGVRPGGGGPHAAARVLRRGGAHQAAGQPGAAGGRGAAHRTGHACHAISLLRCICTACWVHRCC